MGQWTLIAIAALFYGLHNIFTRAAGPQIGETLGALLMESFAAAIILAYFLYKRASGLTEAATGPGVAYALAAGFCVGVGTLAFFAIFSRGGQLSNAGPMVVIGGSILMVLAGSAIFGEPMSLSRVLGALLGLAGLALMRWGA